MSKSVSFEERVRYVGNPKDVEDLNKLLLIGYRVTDRVPLGHGWMVTVCVGQRPSPFSEVEEGDEWKGKGFSDN